MNENEQITTGTRPTRLAPPPSEETIAQPAPSHQPPAVRATDDTPPVRHGVELPKTGYAKVIEAVAGVMAEIRPVEKLGWNKFQNYAHARIGDLNAELTPLMGKHGIVVFQNEVDRQMFDGGKVVSVRYEFTVVHKSGEIWPERPLLTGMSSCRNSKDGFDDKTFNKCHTAARKYFLISLFQIPVEDASDADGSDSNEGNGERPAAARPTRRPPSPDGKATPNVLPIVDGEQPAAWAERFMKACEQSDTPATIQKWYGANLPAFEKLKRADAAIYDSLIDFMDQLEVKLAAKPVAPPKDDPISSGPPAQIEKPKAAPRQRRAAPPPEETTVAETTDEAKLWLESLENAFSACEDAEQLAEAQIKHMVPRKADFSQETWTDAVKLARSHLTRVSPEQ